MAAGNSVDEADMCRFCGDEPVARICSALACARKHLCVNCDNIWHGHPDRKNHRRDPVDPPIKNGHNEPNRPASGSVWSCPHCTFENVSQVLWQPEDRLMCDMCCKTIVGREVLKPAPAGINGNSSKSHVSESANDFIGIPCPICTFLNTLKHARRCEVCDAELSATPKKKKHDQASETAVSGTKRQVQTENFEVGQRHVRPKEIDRQLAEHLGHREQQMIDDQKHEYQSLPSHASEVRARVEEKRPRRESNSGLSGDSPSGTNRRGRDPEGKHSRVGPDSSEAVSLPLQQKHDPEQLYLQQLSEKEMQAQRAELLAVEEVLRRQEAQAQLRQAEQQRQELQARLVEQERRRFEIEKLLQREAREKQLLQSIVKEQERAENEQRRREQQARIEEEKLKRAEEDRLQKEKEEAEQSRLEREAAEQRRLVREEAKQRRREKEEAEQRRREKEEAEQRRREKEEAEQRRLEKEDAEQRRREKEEAEQRRREKEESKQRRREKEESKQRRLEKEEAEQRRQQKEEAERRRQQKEEAEQKRQQKEEAERRRQQKEEAEQKRQQKEEAERRRQQKEEAEQKRQQKEEAERRRQQKEEAEQKRQQKEEAERRRRKEKEVELRRRNDFAPEWMLLGKDAPDLWELTKIETERLRGKRENADRIKREIDGDRWRDNEGYERQAIGGERSWQMSAVLSAVSGANSYSARGGTEISTRPQRTLNSVTDEMAMNGVHGPERNFPATDSQRNYRENEHFHLASNAPDDINETYTSDESDGFEEHFDLESAKPARIQGRSTRSAKSSCSKFQCAHCGKTRVINGRIEAVGFECFGCNKYTCKMCDRAWENDHCGRSCSEFDSLPGRAASSKTSPPQRVGSAAPRHASKQQALIQCTRCRLTVDTKMVRSDQANATCRNCGAVLHLPRPY